MSLDSLSESQKVAVQSYLSVTGTSDLESAISSLEKHNYDLEKAAIEWIDSSVHTQTSRNVSSSSTNSSHDHSPRASSNPDPEPEQNFLITLLSWPIGLLFNILMKVIYAPTYLFSSYRTVAGGAPPDRRESGVEFTEFFEKHYGELHPNFLQTTYVKALEKAKKEIKFLLVFLISEEHDATDNFCRSTISSPELVSFLEENDVLAWAGNVKYTEGYQVSLALQSNAYPFTGIISLRPRSLESGGYKMSVVDRLEGPSSAQEIISRINSQMTRLNPQLSSLRRDRAEQEAARLIRDQQDFAYQQSLLADQEKARRLKEQQETEAREKELQNQQHEKMARLARYRALFLERLKTTLKPEPKADESDVSRFSFRLLNGERVVRRFRAQDTIEDLYLFCETLVPLDDWSPSTSTSQAISELPENYSHKFGFQLLSPYPRTIYTPSSLRLNETKGLWPSANLMIELADPDQES